MIERLAIDEWKEIDRSKPAATAFARPFWSLAVARVNPQLVPDPQRVTLADGTRLIVPLLRARGGRLPWKTWHGSLQGAYTAVIREDGAHADAEQTAAAITLLARAADSLTITPWPLADGLHARLRALEGDGISHVQHETSVIDLRDGFLAARANMSGNARRMAGQAERRGVTCSVEYGPEAVRAYYAMLEESAQRWGIGQPTISFDLIDACSDLGGDAVEVWITRGHGIDEPIGGGVVLYGSRELFFWSAAMRIAHGQLRPSNLLNIRLLDAAVERGADWYNLGSSEGLPGVNRFKIDLGAADVPYVTIAAQRRRLRAWNALRGERVRAG